MDKKPIIVFSLASAGMGHATRDIPLFNRLKNDFELHIFCSGQANNWLSSQYENVHQNHALKAASVGGKISLPLVLLRALVEFPKSIFYILRIALFILLNRPKAVITDFEAHCVYAARLVRLFYNVPIISCDHWTTLRLSERPFELTDSELQDLKKWQGTIGMVSGCADYYLVHKTMETKLTVDNARYVPTPVRDSFLEAGKKTTSDGPVVVSLGHLAPASLTETLEGSSLNFVIYGSKNPRKEKNIEYRAFDETEFIKSLQATPFVIVAANSSAIDSLSFKKPLLYCPTDGQFEQYYCGKMFENLGVSKLVPELTSQVIDNFMDELGPYQEAAGKLSIFDNDKLYEEIKKTISSF
ncbi:MAG: hypothetical protein KC493_09300 [Bacteriovoracaceae bacterium]|nr:hypothetical protein [Bacteriovoracaceae bacterium]